MKNYSIQTFLLRFLWALLLTLPLTTMAQTIRYVKANATGANNGTSWVNAYTDLQNALNAAAVNDEIWVAAGTYKPTQYPTGVTSTDNRDKTFFLNKNVKIYGGFVGTETALSQRNYLNNVTTLSGDFNGDDITTGGGSTLSISNNTENSYHVFITVNLTNATIIDGFIIRGGKANGSNSISFSGLSSFRFQGGAMYNSSSSPTLINVTMNYNAAANGGAMYNDHSSPTLTNVTMNYNAAAANGGAMYNYSSSPTLTNVTMNHNSATSGGAMYNYSSSPTLTNVTMNHNSATSGGAMYNFLDALPEIRNSIIWNNGSSEVSNVGLISVGIGSPTFSYCIVKGSGGSSAWNMYFGTNGGNNLDVDPLFVSATNTSLRIGSPAINAGNNTYNTTTTDLVGNPRLQGGTIDMGAYEYIQCDTTPTNQGGIIKQGDSIVVNNHVYRTSGTYRDTIIRSGLCDSIVVTYLEVTPMINRSLSATQCGNRPYRLPSGRIVNTIGVYRDTLRVHALLISDTAFTVQLFNDTTGRCSDSTELVTLYNTTNGANWRIRTNWLSSSPMNTWYGIRLNAIGRVDSISLSSNQLNGHIPNFNLPNLTQLQLHNNQLSGTIPNFNLPNLTYLSLYSNQLSGNIPNFNLPNLGYLYLYSNQLSGNIPNFNFPNLTYLSLQSNRLSGNIPNFNLPNLQSLSLESNQLSGSIPNFNLPNLTYLNLYSNQLSGNIPNFNLPNLHQLWLHNNQLSGSIPNFNLPNLQWLSLGNNQLSGCIPTRLKINCPRIGATNGNISTNPNLATQSWADYWNNGTGSCQSCQVTTPQYRTIRQGDSIVVNNRVYRTSGTHRDTIIRSGLCDSIVVTNLSVLTCNLSASIIRNANTLTATASGGHGTYRFLWNNQATTQSINNALAGNTYQVTVTDSLGCTATATFIMPAQQNLYNLSIIDAQCGNTNAWLHINMNTTRTCFDAMTLKVQFDTTKVFFENNMTIQKGAAIPNSGVLLHSINRNTLLITVDLQDGCIQGDSGTNVLRIPFRLRPAFALPHATSAFNLNVTEERISANAIQTTTQQSFTVQPTLTGVVQVFRPNGVAVISDSRPITVFTGNSCNALNRSIVADNHAKSVVRLDSFRFARFHRPPLAAVPSPLIGGYDAFLLRMSLQFGAQPLTNRQKIAANVNNDDTITPLDATIIRRRGVGMYPNFADYSNGRLTCDYQFSVSPNLDSTKTCFNLPNVASACDTPTLRVTMITLGDINGDTDTTTNAIIGANLNNIAKNNTRIILDLHKAVRVADEWKIPVYANQITRGLDLQLLNIANPNVFRVESKDIQLFDVLGNGSGVGQNYYIVGNANILQGIPANDTLFYLYVRTNNIHCQNLGSLKAFIDAQQVLTDCITTITNTADINTNHFEIFPNPTMGYLQMTTQMPLSDNTTLRIYDMLGRLIKTVTLQQGSNNFTINITDLANGVYQFNFDNQFKKVVKQ